MEKVFIPAAKVCNIAVYPPGTTFGPRRLRDYELVWMIQGQAEYRRKWPRGPEERYVAPPGSVLLCQPGVIDSFIWDPRHVTRHGYIHFDLPELPAHWPAPHDWPIVRQLEPGDIFLPMFRHLMAWGKIDQVMGGLTLLHMLGAYITGRLAPAQLPVEMLPEPVERALRFLHESLDADATRSISFSDLVDAGAVTSSHLCRLFQKAIGQTPAQAIKHARLNRAAALLFHSNYSIKEIAHHCGFSTPFLFSRQFKQAYRLSPQDMRRQIARGRTPPTPHLHVLTRVDQWWI
ncbi:MAG: helix-turn-helix transcriptional regulator [Phycisphaerales bacterium]|nr:helix-turn-helix transcriptional regulator [Phycisphaerales bacterium]